MEKINFNSSFQSNKNGYNRYSGKFLWLAIFSFVLSSCSNTKSLTFETTRPPTYYLGESPNVRIASAEGSDSSLQELTINEFKSQSKDNGFFSVENAVDQNISFDVNQGRVVMTGKEVNAGPNDVFIKFRLVDDMKHDGEAEVSECANLLCTQRVTNTKFKTVMPLSLTIINGDSVLINDKEYSSEVIWELNKYPESYRERFRATISKSVEKVLNDITPRTQGHDPKIDYSDELQRPILDLALDGNVEEAVTKLEEYLDEHPDLASAHYNLGVLNDVLGNYEIALDYYDEAISIDDKWYYDDTRSNCRKRLNRSRIIKGEV